MLTPLAEATARLEEALHSMHGSRAFLDRAAKLVGRLCASPDLFPATLFVPLSAEEPTVYPLRRAEDESLLMVVYVWPRGVRGAPHEHGTWSILGGVYGHGQHRQYSLGTPDLTIDHEESLRPGVTCALSAEGIHSIGNLGEDPFVCFGVYGRDLAELERRQFDLKTGAVEWLLPTPRLVTLW